MNGSSGQPIRVLRLLSRMNVGGPSIQVINLTQLLGRRGYESRLIVGSPPEIEGTMIPLAEKAGIRPVVIPSLARELHPLKDAAAFASIVAEIRSFRPHIVETHTAKAGMLGRIAALACRVPLTVHTFHGTVFEGYFSPAGSRAVILAERVLARFTNLIIALTPGQRADILGHLPGVNPSKVRVVPLGLDLSRFLAIPRKTGAWRRELGIPDSARLLGVVARLVPIKNHLGLLEAFRMLASEDPTLHLAIVGGGELGPAITQQIHELRLEGRVHMTGIVHAVERVYADLDLVVLPSRNEGAPLVLLEALAAGCPLAVTAVGGVPELVAGIEGARLLATEPEALVSGLRSVLDELEVMRSAAETRRASIPARVSNEQLGKTMDELYRSLLARNMPGSW
ncbi:glycosyltransferase [Candidatus Ozemobacteraceae bacterium]|nr:glycosyltransferase [Candidatus Ozemobacteraceae bacterium]